MTTDETTDGAPADAEDDIDPRQAAKEQYDRLIAAGAPREDAAAVHLNMLANAAARGDKRVIFDSADRKAPWE